jgi:hypothetical protein
MLWQTAPHVGEDQNGSVELAPLAPNAIGKRFDHVQCQVDTLALHHFDSHQPFAIGMDVAGLYSLSLN